MKVYSKALTVMLLSLVLAGFSVDGARAATTNQALTVPTVSIGNSRTLGTIQILETTFGSFTPGMQIIATLPPGSSYVSTPGPAASNNYVYIPPKAGYDNNALTASDVLVNPGSTDKNLILDIVNVTNPGSRACIHLLYNAPGFSQVNIYGGPGDFVVNILETSGAVTSGPVGVSSMASGSATVSALDIPVLVAGSNRQTGAINIRESVAGALREQQHSVSLTLPYGITWKGANITLNGGFFAGDVSMNGIDKDDSGCSRLWLDINHSSFRQGGSNPGIIEIVGTVDISETVGVGELKVSIGGGNPGITAATIAAAMVDKAPVTETRNVAKFVIGSKAFTLNGVGKNMETAPYIKDNRTFLPLYYVAVAVNISDDGIKWNSVDQSITLKKGDQTVQLRIGSNAMYVNGKVRMLDAIPETRDGRTCLPISAIAEVFGYAVHWEPVTETVTIQ